MFEPFQKLFRKHPVPYRQALAEFSKSLTLIADLEQLKDNVIGKVREISHVQSVRLFLLNPELNRFELAESRGETDLMNEGPHLLPDEPLIRWFAVNETWLAVEGNPEILTFFTEGERALLREMHIQCIFPLFVMNRITGLVCLGPKERGDGYDGGEIDFLNALLGQAAFAFENAWLSEQQKTRLRKMYRADRLATLGQLAAGAAHEIRNPLTSIRSTIQYLARDMREEGKRALVRDIIEEVDRINGIIEGLLSFSRPSEPQRENFNLRGLLEQTVGLVSTTAVKRKVEILLDIRPAECMLKADPAQLKQVFLNIIMNALQAMKTGGFLRITVEKKRPGGSSLNSYHIVFQDTGSGIPKCDLEHVFDPFFTTKSDGTGLGLSISYGIIRQHGGDIEIESDVESGNALNHGTTVTVMLPVA